MIHPHFNLQFVQFLADHRAVWLTRFFLLASLFGGARFYLLLTILLYVAWDKRFAIRLSVLILLTVSLNDILKMAIKNPRPFVPEGTYQRKWALTPAQAKSLAATYSTPSRHAMGSSAFFSYLFALTRNRILRAILVAAILCIGASRPYLGVHYAEDVLIGWAVGLSMALIAIAYFERLAALWTELPYGFQIAISVTASAAVWLLTTALNGGHVDGQVQDQDAYCGFLTGIAIAGPLELRFVNFDPRSGGAAAKVLRYAVCIGISAIVFYLLQLAFAPLAPRSTALGSALDYLDYLAAGVAGIFLAPLVFSRMHLAAAGAERVEHRGKDGKYT